MTLLKVFRPKSETLPLRVKKSIYFGHRTKIAEVAFVFFHYFSTFSIFQKCSRIPKRAKIRHGSKFLYNFMVEKKARVSTSEKFNF